MKNPSMKQLLTEWRKVYRKPVLLNEYNDQDYQNEVDEIVQLFVDKAVEFEQYIPVSLESLTPRQQKIVFDIRPPEFANIDNMDSSAMLELSAEEQSSINNLLRAKDWYEGDDQIPPADAEGNPRL